MTPTTEAAPNPANPVAATATAASPALEGALPPFELERPYPPGQLARPSGKIAASAFDEQLARWNLGGASDPNHASNRPNYHPAPRVVVELSPLTPALRQRSRRSSSAASAESLLAEARSTGYWPFRTCFERGLRLLPTLEGETRLRMSVSVSGKVSRAKLLQTHLRDGRTSECLLRAARELSFRRAPSRRVDVALAIKLWPGDAPLPPLDERSNNGAWDSQRIFGALQAHGAGFARCCANALERDHKLWGRWAFLVTNDAEGRVREAHEAESQFPDAEATACVHDELAQLEPQPGTPPYIFAARCGLPPSAPPAPNSLPSAPDLASRAEAPGSAPRTPSPSEPQTQPPAPPAAQSVSKTSGGSAFGSAVPQ